MEMGITQRIGARECSKEENSGIIPKERKVKDMDEEIPWEITQRKKEREYRKEENSGIIPKEKGEGEGWGIVTIGLSQGEGWRDSLKEREGNWKQIPQRDEWGNPTKDTD